MDRPTQSADDFAEHRRSYEGFIRIVVIAVFTLLAHLVALAIGCIRTGRVIKRWGTPSTSDYSRRSSASPDSEALGLGACAGVRVTPRSTIGG